MWAIGRPAVPLSVSESFFGITTEVKLPVNCAGVQLAKPSHMRQLRSCWETQKQYMWNKLHVNISASLTGTIHRMMLGSGLLTFRRRSRWSGTGDWVFFSSTQTTCLSTFSGNIHVRWIYGRARQMCHSAFSSYLYPLHLAGSWRANLPLFRIIFLCIVLPQVFLATPLNYTLHTDHLFQLPQLHRTEKQSFNDYICSEDRSGVIYEGAENEFLGPNSCRVPSKVSQADKSRTWTEQKNRW